MDLLKKLDFIKSVPQTKEQKSFTWKIILIVLVIGILLGAALGYAIGLYIARLWVGECDKFYGTNCSCYCYHDAAKAKGFTCINRTGQLNETMFSSMEQGFIFIDDYSDI